MLERTEVIKDKNKRADSSICYVVNRFCPPGVKTPYPKMICGQTGSTMAA